MLPVYRIQAAAAAASMLLLHIILAADARDCSKADVRLDEAWIDPDCDGLLEMDNDSLQGSDDAVKLASALQAGTKVTRLHVLGPGSVRCRPGPLRRGPDPLPPRLFNRHHTPLRDTVQRISLTARTGRAARRTVAPLLLQIRDRPAAQATTS